MNFIKFLVIFFFTQFGNKVFCFCLFDFCCGSNFFNYTDENNFIHNGLDIYIFDEKENFDSYYRKFYNDTETIPLNSDEKRKIEDFLSNPNNCQLDFVDHQKAWFYNFYILTENGEYNKNTIENLIEEMSTTKGNFFNWESNEDESTKYEEERHNKNVIIVNLKNENDKLFEYTIFKCRHIVNMSYCPIIIFTGNLDFKQQEFEEKLKNANDQFTKEKVNSKKEEIKAGEVDWWENINAKKCYYIKKDTNFVNELNKKLELIANYYNNKQDEITYETMNFAVIGQSRTGKSTLVGKLSDNPFGTRSANDRGSVTRNNKRISHSSNEEIPITILDTPGFEEKNNGNYVKKFEDWLNENYVGVQGGTNKDNLHCIIYLINADFSPSPENFKKELYSKEELDLIKKLKNLEIPVVFAITHAKDTLHGYKYLRKFFGDLMLENDLSNFNSNEQSWDEKEQWLCPKWTRGTLIQLCDDDLPSGNGTTGKFGLVRLVNSIYDLLTKNEQYYNRLPSSLQGENFRSLCNKLKEQFIEEGFKNDEREEPLSKNRQDIIKIAFEDNLEKSLSTLHDDREATSKNLATAKEILNYVCAYDYLKDNNTIANEVADKFVKNNPFKNWSVSLMQNFGLGFFLPENVKGENSLKDIIKKMVKNSLPEKNSLLEYEIEFEEEIEQQNEVKKKEGKLKIFSKKISSYVSSVFKFFSKKKKLN